MMTLLSFSSPPPPTRYSTQRAMPVIASMTEPGLTLARSAALARIDPATIKFWLRTEPAFVREVAHAEATMIDALLKEVRQPKGDARKIHWLLERRFPEDFTIRRDPVPPPPEDGVMDAEALRAYQALD